jgi:hypothetical protein
MKNLFSLALFTICNSRMAFSINGLNPENANDQDSAGGSPSDNHDLKRQASNDYLSAPISRSASNEKEILPEYNPSLLLPTESSDKFDKLTGLQPMKSTIETKNMIDYNFDYKRVLKQFGIEDDGKSLEEINALMAEQLNGKKVSTVLIATGTAGDILPLVHFVKHVSEKLPWIEFTRAAVTTREPVRREIEKLGIKVEEFMHETMRNQKREFALWEPPYGNLEIVMRNWIMGSDFSNSLNRHLKDAQVVFLWNVYPVGTIFTDGLLGRSLKESNRLFISVEPTTTLDNLFNDPESLQDQRKNPVKPQSGQYGGYLSGYPMLAARSGAFLAEYVHKETLIVGNMRVEPNHNYIPSEELLQFIQSNKRKKLIYFGLGSMGSDYSYSFVVKEAQDGFCQTIKKLGSENYAYLWQTGLSASDRITDNYIKRYGCNSGLLLLTEYIPHSWLFPQMDVVIHHGGSGTTHETLFSGVPSVICPIINHAADVTGDQSLFAKMMDSFGYGRGLYSDHCNPGNLPEAVEDAANNPAIKERVQYGQNLMQKEYEKDVGTKFLAKYLEGNLAVLQDGLNVTERETTAKCLHYFEPFKLKTNSGNYCKVQNNDIQCENTETEFFELHHFVGLGQEPEKRIEVPIEGTGFLAFGQSSTEKGSQYLVPPNEGDTLRVIETTMPNPLGDTVSLALLDLPADQYDHCIRNDDKVSFVYRDSQDFELIIKKFDLIIEF